MRLFDTLTSSIIKTNRRRNMLTFLNISIMMESEHMFDLISAKGELKIMTENEKELIKLIRENDNPEQALMTATVIILGFLKQHESSEAASSACLQAHA